MLLVSTRKTKFKPDVEFDDLSPGLNIDLGYYIYDGDFMDCKKKKKKKDELLSLLTR